MPNTDRSVRRGRTGIFDHQIEDRGYDTPCWISTYSTTRYGYCQAKIQGKSHRVHRLMYEREFGSIPTGTVIDHLCRVRACINPAHLEAVSQAENTRRGDLTKLTVDQVSEIKTRLRHETQTALATEFGVRQQTIYCIKIGRSWADVEPKTEYQLAKGKNNG